MSLKVGDKAKVVSSNVDYLLTTPIKGKIGTITDIDKSNRQLYPYLIKFDGALELWCIVEPVTSLERFLAGVEDV